MPLVVLEKILACKTWLLSSLKWGSLTFSPLGGPNCKVLSTTDVTKMAHFFSSSNWGTWLVLLNNWERLLAIFKEVWGLFQICSLFKTNYWNPWPLFCKLRCLWDLSSYLKEETQVYCSVRWVAELLLIGKEIKLSIVTASYLLWRDAKQYQYLEYRFILHSADMRASCHSIELLLHHHLLVPFYELAPMHIKTGPAKYLFLLK